MLLVLLSTRAWILLLLLLVVDRTNGRVSSLSLVEQKQQPLLQTSTRRRRIRSLRQTRTEFKRRTTEDSNNDANNATSSVIEGNNNKDDDVKNDFSNNHGKKETNKNKFFTTDETSVDDDADRPGAVGSQDGDPVVIPQTSAVSMPRIVISFSSDTFDLSDQDYGQFVENMIGDAILQDLDDSFKNLILDIRTEFAINQGVPGSKAAVFCKGRAYFHPKDKPSKLKLAELVSYHLNDVEVERRFSQEDEFKPVEHVKIVVGDEEYFPDLVPVVVERSSSGRAILGVGIVLCILVAVFAVFVLFKHVISGKSNNNETVVLEPSHYGIQ